MGSSIEVMIVFTGTSIAAPVASSAEANSRARRTVRMKAPEPHLTSITTPRISSPNFLLRTLETMSGTLSTVAVASLSA